MAKRGASFALFAMLVLFSAGLAHAGTGTLKGTFLYKDSATGVVTPLDYGFVYLHSVSKPPPMEKFFSKADYILGATLSNGVFSLSAPEGSYYIRLLRRKVIGGVHTQFGPPQEGDYTWFQTAPITITAGLTLDLGTKYAVPFGSAPIRLSGTIKTQAGAPVVGKFVRAQTEPCLTDGENNNVNQCGPAKYLAQMTTDANGMYTMYLKDPGTYYIYVSPCLTSYYQQYTGNQCGMTAGPGPITLSLGDNKTLDFSIWQY